jgi:phenylacetate-coenzyme A ligase PaaK-like adenylate-forming protein
MVRYRSRDHALVVGTRCACGRTSPRIRCIGRTDDMLIYKGMNVFPTAIRDLVAHRFAGQVEPMLRIWKDSREQVRFDAAIPVEIEASVPGDDAQRATSLARHRGRGAKAFAGARVRRGVASGEPAAQRLQEPTGDGERPGMKFERASLSARHLWSSPFVRWQGGSPTCRASTSRSP